LSIIPSPDYERYQPPPLGKYSGKALIILPHQVMAATLTMSPWKPRHLSHYFWRPAHPEFMLPPCLAGITAPRWWSTWGKWAGLSRFTCVASRHRQAPLSWIPWYSLLNSARP